MNRIIVLIPLIIIVLLSSVDAKKHRKKKRKKAPVATTVAPQKEEAEEETSKINIIKIDAKMGEINVDFSLTAADTALKEFTVTSHDNVLVKSKTGKTPVNLWIFLDSSSLCSRMEFDKYVKTLIPTLKKNLHPRSILTIVSYQGDTKRFFYNHKPLKKLDKLAFKCSSKTLSKSYEVAINDLLTLGQKSNLPTYAWIFSAGNTALSKETARQLSSFNIKLNVIIYNFLLKQQITAALKHSQKLLGVGNYMYSFVDISTFSEKLPEAWFFADITIPDNLAGTNQIININYLKDKNVVTKKEAQVFIPKDNMYILYKRIILAVAGLVLLVLFTFGLYKLIKFYLPCKCYNCNHYYRHKDGYCLKCKNKIIAYLVHTPDVPNAKREIIVLENKKIAIGTHKKSLLKLRRDKKAKKMRYFELSPKQFSEKKMAFLFTPNREEGNLFCKIGGKQITTSRYLRSGDEIKVCGHTVVFMAGESSDSDI